MNNEKPVQNTDRKSIWKRRTLGILCLLGAIAMVALFVQALRMGYIRRAVTSIITIIILLAMFVRAFPPKSNGASANDSSSTEEKGKQ